MSREYAIALCEKHGEVGWYENVTANAVDGVSWICPFCFKDLRFEFRETAYDPAEVAMSPLVKLLARPDELIERDVEKLVDLLAPKWQLFAYRYLNREKGCRM